MSYDDSFPCISTPIEKAFRAAFSDYLAKNYEQVSAASNIEISVEDRKEY